MKLRTKYIILISLLHLICLVLTYFIFYEERLLFIVAEILIVCSVLLSISLYRQLIRPLRQLKEGVHAIRDRDFNVKFMPTGKKEMDELIDVYNQMIDELRMERTKQEAQHFFLEKLIHTSPTGIVIMDYDHKVTQVNPRATAILGAEQQSFLDQTDSLGIGESRVFRKEGGKSYKVQKSHFVDRGFPRVFVMIEELTAELFEAEKNAYGKVIRMMAHEVNNTIGAVNSIISLALGTESLWNKKEYGSIKNAMQIAVGRNQNLNLFMRNFADLVKLSPVNRVQTDMCALVHSVAEFMTAKAAEKEIVFEFDLPESPFYVSADVQQMEQVLVNVVKNAIESIEDAGRISFLMDVSRKELVISDTGRGISTETNELLFQPFFSTKKGGQGIGLMLVREILVNHNFSFSLKTIVPGQTEFVVKL
ncbi:two-component system sensor histidine kinase [Pedobacter sp. BAL39]|uniref:sensor histidine kinase n=1 Tax=Pedobacter sp. BAL39 TaxID=391596 RepID=UPI00015599A7|nr:ATP-binding protein [Pedobacter sp. BAL39]EDM38313.1 two-component system sensor histidine kinase [Pedobacter sp. BAL39]